KDIGLGNFSQIPCGIPGVEHRPQLMATYGVAAGRMTLSQMVALLSTNAAKLFGVYPRKGTLQVGSDADIVIWNPHYEGMITAQQQLQNVDYTPYEGFKVSGRAEHVLLRGELVVKAGQVIQECKGHYVPRRAVYCE
ncbi:MAG: amidohydrolase family protein, partial [Cellulosilyticaceae bacterium]